MSTIELAAIVARLADLIQGMTEQYGIYNDGRAPIQERAIQYALLGLGPAVYFDPREKETRQAWSDAWRQTRKDGTRDHYKALRQTICEVLTAELPGDWRTSCRYTPDQISGVARKLATGE